MCKERYTYINIVLLSVLLVAGFACEDSAGPGQSEPPELPPFESLEMDFSTFNRDSTLKTKSVQGDTGEYSNATKAFTYTIGARFLGNVVLAFPRALLKAASEADPALNEDGQWEWSYSASHDSTMYSTRLVAQAAGEQVAWQMYITANTEEVQVDEFLFFEGTTSRDGRQGQWVYYDLLTNQTGTAVIQLNWSIEDENNAQLDIEVLNTTIFDIEPGTTLNYSSEGALRTLDVFDASTGDSVEIAWNTETNIGYIIASDYNNGEKACWDATLKNTVCSEVEL